VWTPDGRNWFSAPGIWNAATLGAPGRWQDSARPLGLGDEGLLARYRQYRDEASLHEARLGRPGPGKVPRDGGQPLSAEDESAGVRDPSGEYLSFGARQERLVDPEAGDVVGSRWRRVKVSHFTAGPLRAPCRSPPQPRRSTIACLRMTSLSCLAPNDRDTLQKDPERPRSSSSADNGWPPSRAPSGPGRPRRARVEKLRPGYCRYGPVGPSSTEPSGLGGVLPSTRPPQRRRVPDPGSRKPIPCPSASTRPRWPPARQGESRGLPRQVVLRVQRKRSSPLAPQTVAA